MDVSGSVATRTRSTKVDSVDIDDENEPILVDDEIEPKKKKQPNKNASLVWDHFSKAEKVGDKMKSTCNYCGTEFTCNSDVNGTSSMRTHLLIRCKVYELSDFNKKKRKREGTQTTLGFEPVGEGGSSTVSKLTAVSFSVDACRKALAEMIILDELPFRFVEGQGFRKFMRVVQPKWTKIPSRITVAKDVLQLFKDGKKELKKVFKNQRICLTTDTWTSLQNLNYMCLTAHYIDSDWKLNKKIINFCLVPNHKGETLGKEVERCLVEWGIDNILTITIDNASSNNGIIDFMKKKTMKRDSTILGHEFLHVRCCAHILNLIVREGLKDVDSSISRVRNIVRYVRSSPQRYLKFQHCALTDKIDSKLKPCLDVPTRWNSTFFMLERALIYQKAFERLEEEDNLNVVLGVREDELGVDNANDLELEVDGSSDIMESGKSQGKGRAKQPIVGTPSIDDWNVVELYVEILRLFYIVTEKFSGSLYVTCNSFFKEVMTIKIAIAKLEVSDDYNLVLLARGMNKKYDKYWGNFAKINPLLLYANVLDPRYKFVYVRWSLGKYNDKGEVENKVVQMKDGMKRLFNWYEKRSIDEGQAPNAIESSRNKDKMGKRSMDLCEAMDSEFLQHMEEETNMVSKSELERYWVESNEDPKVESFDLLHWWSINSSKYPILSQMARDILAIPVSTVASESAFSTGGRVLDPYRTSLSPKMAEALICAQNWLRYPSEISLRDQLDEVEELESVVSEAFEESCLTDL